MNNRFLLLLGLLLFFGTARAQQISMTQAQSRAFDFLQHQAPRHSAARGNVAVSNLELVYTRERPADHRPLYYVFNNEEHNGFVIVGGDERARDILFYSDQGCYDVDKMPENFRWWMEQLEADIARAIDHSEQSVATINWMAAPSRAPRRSVEELLQTRWSQEAPYWNDIPKLGNNYDNFVTGCVATAMAQVMKFHEHPETGMGSHSYSWYFETSGSDAVAKPKLSKGSRMSFSSDFSQHTYAWGAMQNTYASSSADEEANAAVAQLMYDCGVAVSMQYGTSNYGGSGAYSRDIQPAMVTYFDYDKASKYVSRNYYSDDAWEALIYNEIANNRPVVYGGRTATNSGHQFVCDGYDANNNMFHFNWGWNGSFNGYCPLTGAKALLPGGTGIGGGGEDEAYNVSQDAVIGLMPNQNGTESPNVWQYASNNQEGLSMLHNGTTVADYEYSDGSTCSLTLALKLVNYSTTFKDFKLGVKAIDRNTGIEYIWPDLCRWQLNFAYSGTAPQMSFDLAKLSYNGIYDIVPVVRPNIANWNGEWTEISLYATTHIPTVTVTCKEATEPQDIAFEISDTQVEAYRTLHISHPLAYTGTVTYRSSNTSVATVNDQGVVTGVKPGQATITADGSDMYFAGNLLFNATTATFDVEVIEVVKSTPNATISATAMSAGGTVSIEISSGFDGEIEYITSDSQVATVVDGVVTGVAAGEATIKVVLHESNLWNGATFEFDVTVLDAVTCYMPYAPYFANDNNPYVDDQDLHFSIINNSSNEQTTYFIFELYKVSDDGNQQFLWRGGMVYDFPANFTYNSTYNLSAIRSVTFVPGQKYKMLFYDHPWDTRWNYSELAFTYRDKIEIPYSITSVGIGTLILPFDASLLNGWRAYSCDEVRADGTLVMSNVESLKRNTPYIIMGDAGSTTFVGPDAVEHDAYSVGLLTGALTDRVGFSEGDYVLQNHDGHVAFYAFNPADPKPNDGMCKPNRAFVHLDCISDDHASFAIDPEITGIEPICGDNVMQLLAGVYGTDGVRRTSLQPGMNIVVDASGNVHKCWIK